MSELIQYKLFTRPSFIEGTGRIFDFWGSLNKYNHSPTSEEADFKAILSDWFSVGDDIRFAISSFNKSN